MQRQQLRDDMRAERVADDVGAIQLHMIEQADDVERHFASVLPRIVRLAAPAVAAEVERDRAVPPRQRGKQPAAHEIAVEIAGERMQQDHRLSAAGVDVAQRDAGGVEVAVGRRARHGIRRHASAHALL